MTNQVARNAILSNGIEMPYIGFGVYKVPKEQSVQTVLTALNAGYRHIDTAKIYENETEVGQALKETSLKREDIFLTTKVWNDDQGYDATLRAFDSSLQKLDTPYLDLYLVHWPIAGRFVETYKAIERLYDEKIIRSIGVSNFHIHHLQKLEATCNIKPMVNQVECHPALAQDELLAYCKKENIQFEAWSPLMRGKDIFTNPVVVKLAKKYGKTPAQIILRWNIERDVIVIPKTVTPERIYENINIFDFSLSDDDMQLMATLNKNQRVGTNPDTYNF